jgi:rhodanese-related sulfurtransferase
VVEAGPGADLKEVGPTEAAGLIEKGSFLLDVREPDEWLAGHAPQAVHIPLGQLAEHLDQVPSDTQVVAVCRGGHRSATAAKLLLSEGRDAINLAGGMKAWESEGLTVETDDHQPGTVI